MVFTPVVRRAATFAFALSLAASGLALADTVAADGDAVTAGSQAAVDLGAVAPGAHLSLDVVLRLTCGRTSHATPASEIAVSGGTLTVPDDGALTVGTGKISVPADWPAADQPCPEGIEPVDGDVPASLAITAPTTAGADREYAVLFDLSPADGVSNIVAFSFVLDVLDSAAADTTAPLLTNLPAPRTAWTASDTAVVAWPLPTATDDMDPAPAVACDPPSGSSFPVGITTVTCTATDASGNATTGSFTVTVLALAAQWLEPLGPGTATAVHAGRVIPVKLALSAGGAPLGPGDVPAPAVLVVTLAGCAVGAAVDGEAAPVPMAWDDGTWRLQLDTDGWGPGCRRLVAIADGSQVAIADVVVVTTVGERRQAG